MVTAYKMSIYLLFSFLSVLSFTLCNPSAVSADTIQYYYDELGRLTQVINGSNITNYNLDEVGNVVSVINGSLADTPSVTAASPTALLVGVKTPVVFSGQNLLSAGSVAALGNNIIVNSVTFEANKITTMLTAQSAGSETVRITFRDNNQTTHQTSFDTFAATVTMNPSLVVAQPNTTFTTTISLNPHLSYPVTIWLRTSNATVATVPATITIPAGETASLQINTLSEGVSNITNLNNVAYGLVVSEKPVDGNGVTSLPVSVMIMPSVQSVPGIIATVPVSVTIAPSVQQPAASVSTSRPVSVSIMPSASTIAPSVTIAPPVSVIISQ
jgi:hypothetical protein